MKVFYNVKELVNSNEIDSFVVVEQFPDIDYSLIYRKSNYQPWVAAWGYRNDGKSWAQGHYFDNLVDAMEYIRTVKGRPNYYRMDEIASKAIDGLFEDDVFEAQIYCEETLELSDEEKEYFGILDKQCDYYE